MDKQNDVVGTGSKGRMVERDKEFVSNELGENIDGVYCGMSDIFKILYCLKVLIVFHLPMLAIRQMALLK